MDLAKLPIAPGPGRSPRAGERPVRAFLFDTYGTVCDFYRPLARAFDELAARRGATWDSARLGIEWRGLYARTTFAAAFTGAPFRPLADYHRENLRAVVDGLLPSPLSDEECESMLAWWNRLDPWPDAVPGLLAMRAYALVAPLSNGNFDDMARLARHGGLPWDAVCGSSLVRAYKPAPSIYLDSVAALGLEPADACMVAAHQVDLFYAAGHGMQTAFVRRPDEFGGPTKPVVPEPGADLLAMAEVHPEGDWTFVADDFVDLARQAAPRRQ